MNIPPGILNDNIQKIAVLKYVYIWQIASETKCSNMKNFLYVLCLLNNKKLWEELSPSYLDTTRAKLKTTRPTILLLLRVYSLPR
jgi:ABC-type microcin C transport system permease subunit YejB